MLHRIPGFIGRLGTAARKGISDFLQSANNLSDLTNVTTAKTNLGLAAIASSGSASDLAAGTVPAARMPALTGDTTSSAGSVATTVGKIQGRAVSNSAPNNGDALTWNTSNNQWQPSAGGSGGAGGECGRLLYVSATQIKFDSYKGAAVKIAGSAYTIPNGGVTVGNGGLSASTTYYVYVYNNAGTLTLELSTTGHAMDTTSGNEGVEIKSGDNSRSLVGMIRTNASSQFQDGASFRGVLSWFNRRSLT